MRNNLVRSFDMMFETTFLRSQLAAIADDARIARSMGDRDLEDSIWAETDTWIDLFTDRAAVLRGIEKL
jgi:hypothetical protein